MPYFLHIHPQRTDSPQNWFRDAYRLRQADFELNRNINYKGDAVSDLKGGRITAVLEGFGDENLFDWLFRSDVKKSGEVIKTDIYETVIEKFHFAKAALSGYRLQFNADSDEATSAILTIDANEITTDNELYYEAK
jgi:hypothetical protein